jgi:hypothetical protein
MAAHALLAVIAANEHANRPAPAGLIALTRNEIRKLFTILVIEPCRTEPCPNLVGLATTPSVPRPHQSLPATKHRRRRGITIYGWSIS